MPKYPVIKPMELIRILELLGFEKIRQKGSHIQLKHIDGRQTTVPMHKGRDLSPILLKTILKEINLELDEFKDLL
jgi:predicted RNA binding protein YcfA (HicA-like mRNA interferase family)